MIKKMEMQFRAVVILSAVLSTFVFAPLAYMLADNQPPFEYDASRSYVVPSKTPAGRQMTVHWKFSKVNRLCPGYVTKIVVDQTTGVRTLYDPTPAARVIDEDSMTLDKTFYLPPTITEGKKWYYSEAEYACNPLQHVYPLRVRTPRLSFEVTE